MRSRTLPILEMSRNEMRGLLLDMEPGSKSVPARTRLRRRKISLHAHIALRRILIEAIRYNGALRRQRSWSRITSPTRTQTHHDQRAKNEGRFERATSRTGGIAAREDSKIKSRRSCLAVQTSRLKRRGSNLDVKLGGSGPDDLPAATPCRLQGRTRRARIGTAAWT